MTKKLFMTAMSLLVLVLFASCSEKGTETDKPGDGAVDKVAGDVITGKICYDDGSNAEGVVVSDGYTCTITDSEGCYSIKTNANAVHISYSIPEDAAVETGGTYKLPVFFKKIGAGNKGMFDFTLKKQDVEKEFRFLAIGDIQTNKDAHIERFKKETMSELNGFAQSHKDKPLYAVHLGDITTNKWDLWTSIVPLFGEKNLGVKLFSVIGNHDHMFPMKSDLQAQRKFENEIGPVNYSFNRGDVHFICADDVIHGAKESAVYDAGFLTWQYEWIKQDLSYVSKDKHVVLCIHIPFREAFKSENGFGDHPGSYYNEVLALLAEFKGATIFSGHIHRICNTYVHTSGSKIIQEYAAGAACGGHWTSNCCFDGSPNGYEVVEFNGSGIKNLYYKATKHPESYQMRIYNAPDFPDFQETVDSKVLNLGWGLKTLTNTYVVNIWNMTDEWKTEVFLDGVSAGPLNRKDLADAYLIYHYSTHNLGHLDDVDGKWHHMYYFRPKTTFTEMKVVATDPFGNKYECTKITGPSDTDAYIY